MSPRKDRGIAGLGARLRIAREGLGMSMRSAAELLASDGILISHGTIGNYERGLTRPPEEVLAALSRIYKRSVEWLREAGNVLEGVRYRALKSVTVRDKTLYSTDATAWLDLYLYLEALLALPLTPSRHIPPIDRNINGKTLAAKIRSLWHLGDHPIPSAIRLLEDFGLHAVQIYANARIDAFAARLRGTRVVVLNAGLSADRMRLTALHELAHHLYADCLGGTSLSEDEIEERAFEFASHLLIPSSVLREAFTFKSMVRLVEYKERYGISLAAMVYRGRRERLITQRQYEKVWQQFSKLGFRKDEPGNVPPDRPVRMESLIDLAVTKGKMSFSQIAGYLNVDEDSVRNKVIAAIGGTARGVRSPSPPNVVSFQTYRDGLDLI